MSRTIRTTLITAGVLATLAGTAVAADAPVVGEQTTWTGRTSPVSVPGNHLHRGDRIPKGAVLVLRTVRVTGGTAERNAVLTLPKGKRLTGIAVDEGTDVRFRIPKAQSRYVGRRRITFVVSSYKNHTGHTRVYAYGR
jgi:hypothetical protein